MTAEELRAHLDDFQKVVKALEVPFVNVYVSVLGGPEKACLIFTLGLDPKDTWPYGILENSYYAKCSLHWVGRWVLEAFSGPASKKIRKYGSTNAGKIRERILELPEAMEKNRT